MKKIIKLRDATSEDFEKWKNKKCGEIYCKDCVFRKSQCTGPSDKDSWINNKDLYSDKFLDQEIEVEIEVPDILTKEEKEYLSNVIKPFRNEIEYISKHPMPSGRCFIIIDYKNNNIRCTSIPTQKNEEKYSNMVARQPYSLKELGL